ncbi:MAG TPA: carbon-nitrogen hydrolase family protein [Candidatus Omnitrophota bacterium]|nr:carbon-nitrogen hydrolase family protein [Candidatus Omnitrophota bacterium]
MALKVAIIQLNAGADKSANINKARRLVGRAIRSRARLIVLPEVFNSRAGIKTAKDVSRVAEKIPGPSTSPLMDLAGKHKVYILAGSVLEKAKPKKAYNTSILISPTGQIVAKYRKQNLFKAVIGKKALNESRWLLAGKKRAVASIRGFRAGLTICYDLRFPSLYRDYARRGVNVMCAPACFTRKTGEAHWQTLVRARAIENLSYVLAANQCGKDARGVMSYGHSMIVGPWGNVLAQAGAGKEAIIYATLTKKALRDCRKILPSFK